MRRPPKHAPPRKDGTRTHDGLSHVVDETMHNDSRPRVATCSTADALVEFMLNTPASPRTCARMTTTRGCKAQRHVRDELETERELLPEHLVHMKWARVGRDQRAGTAQRIVRLIVATARELRQQRVDRCRA